MKSGEFIQQMRPLARALVRELGVLGIGKETFGKSPQACHALVEIDANLSITISQLSELLLVSFSAASRLVDGLMEQNLVQKIQGADKRQKQLVLTSKGKSELTKLHDFSNHRIKGALEYLSEQQMQAIINSMSIYTSALKKNRLIQNQISIYTLSTSRVLRHQIASMVGSIQKNEFNVAITDDTNACIMKAEDNYHHKNKCNFWYAVDGQGNIIACIGLKKITDSIGEVKKFFVAKNYRGKGLAQKLMKKLFLRANQLGFDTIILGTIDILESAINFYKKIGFEQTIQLPKGYRKCEFDTHFFVGKTSTLLKAL
jgi:DNA-binding MarR family transcriptional regulator/N-acetylglutamate synthase-like GNAT family acetyltransferase